VEYYPQNESSFANKTIVSCIKSAFLLFGTRNVYKQDMNRILIIEDQIEAKEILLKEYQKENVEIDIAETGIEAFFYIHQYEYDTVIVSNDLCDLDGMWIIKYLKDKHECNLIFTSMFNHERLKSEADRMHVIYLRKPLKMIN